MKRNIRPIVKAFIKRRLPFLGARVMDPLLRMRNRWRKNRLRSVEALVVKKYGLRVQSGPFAGLAYIGEAFYSGFSPKILGCYEDELTVPIRESIAANYKMMIDVGCAEGYYAVGFAMASPQTMVYAFDIDARSRSLCAKLAEINGVTSRVRIGGFCDHATLNQIAETDVFLLCDCEGYEVELLDPQRVPALYDWDILVELHDFAKPNTTRTIVQRFEASHDIVLVDCKKRKAEQVPAAQFLRSRSDRALAISDLRSRWQQWAWLRSKRRRGRSGSL